MANAILVRETFPASQSIPVKAPMSHRTIAYILQWLPYTFILIYKDSRVV